MKKRIILIGLFLLKGLLIAQQTTTVGNFLRIDFTKNEINSRDTVWQWKETMRVGFSSSEIIVSVDKSGIDEYITKLTSNDDPYLPKMINSIYNVTTKKEIKIVETFPSIDYDRFWYYVPKTLAVNNGIWFFYGYRSPSIFVRNDSVYSCQTINGINVFHFTGSVNEKKIFCVQDTKSSYMYDVEISKSPVLKTNNIVFYNNNPLLIRDIYYLKDSLLINFVPGLTAGFELDKINSKGITFQKTIVIPSYNGSLNTGDFHFAGDKLFYLDNKRLVEQKFDYSLLGYNNKKILIDSIKLFSNVRYAFSNNCKYFAYINKDTLTVYSLSEEKEIFRQSIKSIKYAANLLIEYPYVYLKQIKIVTAIEGHDNFPNTFSLSQNYPNPFNPQTTIKYSIPTNQLVTIKIFDPRGREITTLVNETKPAGNYEVKFDGSNLSSGIYFYRIQSGSFTETNKMILLK